MAYGLALDEASCSLMVVSIAHKMIALWKPTIELVSKICIVCLFCYEKDFPKNILNLSLRPSADTVSSIKNPKITSPQITAIRMVNTRMQNTCLTIRFDLQRASNMRCS